MVPCETLGGGGDLPVGESEPAGVDDGLLVFGVGFALALGGARHPPLPAAFLLLPRLASGSLRGMSAAVRAGWCPVDRRGAHPHKL